MFKMTEKLALQSAELAPSISRGIGENRRKSSGSHPSFEVLFEEDGEDDDQTHQEMNLTIKGSELAVAGGVPRKKGLESDRRRVTPFNNNNSYYDLVQSVLSANDPFDSSSDANLLGNTKIWTLSFRRS